MSDRNFNDHVTNVSNHLWNCLDGMKEEAKLGSAGLVMAIVGGALMPPVQATILDWGGPGFSDIQILGFIDEVNFSFIMPLFGLWLLLFIVIAL